MKQKTITLEESQIENIQILANQQHKGDFSRMMRVVLTEYLRDKK